MGGAKKKSLGLTEKVLVGTLGYCSSNESTFQQRTDRSEATTFTDRIPGLTWPQSLPSGPGEVVKALKVFLNTSRYT